MNLVGTGVAVAWNELPDEVNILVIGGGLAGLELAKQLDQADVADVLVVEAGTADDLHHIHATNDPRHAEALWINARSDKYYIRPWVSWSEPHFADGAGIRRRLGGRSLYWHGVILPIEEWALQEPWWPRPVVRDLLCSWRDGPPLYDRVRSELFAWSDQPIAGQASAENDALLSIGRFELVAPPRAVRAVDEGNRRWRAYTPLSHWLEQPGEGPSRMGGNVRIASGVEALGVQIDAEHAAGAVVREVASGANKRILAKAVVLAAGTIESTRLAIQALCRVGVLPDRFLNGLVDHIVQGFNVTLKRTRVPDQLLAKAREGLFCFAPGKGGSRSNVFVQADLSSTDDVELEVWMTGEQLRTDEGVVSCCPSAEWPWEVSIRTAITRDDREVITAQREELQEFWDAFCAELGYPGSALKFDQDFTAPTRTLRSTREERWDPSRAARYRRPVTWSSPLGTEDHEGGTLPLGGVLDECHEFLDVPRLFAAGPATFPRQGAANPSLTSLALAKRLASFLAE